MKRIMLFWFLGIVTNFVYGQIEIKEVITELQGDGYTYIHKWDESGLITLYNKENIYTDVPVVFKDTGESPPDYLSKDPVIEDGWSHDKYVEIINDAFTIDQRQALKGRFLHILILWILLPVDWLMLNLHSLKQHYLTTFLYPFGEIWS